MHPDLIAYLTGSLDDDARTQFEVQMQSDANLKQKVAAARQRVAPLFDVEPIAPPPGLVLNTIGFIAGEVCRDRPQVQVRVGEVRREETNVTSPAPAPISRGGFERSWWRRMDVIVAASILLTALGLGLPVVSYLRYTELRVRCENNLKELWSGLNAYQMQRGALPDVNLAKRPAASVVIPMLRDAGVLTSDVGYCPAAAKGEECLHTGLDVLDKMPEGEFQRAAARLLPGFAYSLGYRDHAGRVQGPAAALADVPAAQLPILADAPAVPVALGNNSPNHSGRGQNVLYSDGHIAFKKERTAGLPGDDIYLNRDQKVAAGVNVHDVVLGGGGSQP